MNRQRQWLSAMAMVLAMLAAGVVRAQTAYTWGGSTLGDWFDEVNWTPSDQGYPGAGDSVTVSSGSILLTNATAALASFVITNTATLTFTNHLNAKLTATEVAIHGTVNHVANDVTNAVAGEWPILASVWIECTNLTVGINGKIDCDARGYGHTGSPYLSYGPGGGTADDYRAAGGAYGGRGGDAESAPGGTLYAAGGTPYGIAADPVQPGSSGGGRLTTDSGGFGGGLVRIDAASNVTVNGSITVNGAVGSGSRPGGGSGGGIRIACRTLQGTGSITANGGNGSNSDTGGGGGGRIAVIYDADSQAGLSSQPTIAFAANPGLYGAPRPGTVYLTDIRFFPSVNLVSQSAQVFNDTTNFPLPSLSLGGSSMLIFPTGATIQIAGNLTISNTASMEIYEGSLSVSSNLTLTNTARLYVYGGITNAGTPDYSGLVSVTGDVTVAGGAYIYSQSHPTNGGSPLFRMQNLTVASGGYFDASGRGYAGTTGNGYGPGGGEGGTVNWAGAGGYGGAGGNSGSGLLGGGTYGNTNAPVDPGSSGGGRYAPPGTVETSGAGGGVVRLEVNGTARIDGEILADGIAGPGSTGGGAGGSIYILCKAFKGGGYLYARGGDTVHAGAGGGGRIAVWRNRQYDFDGSTADWVSAAGDFDTNNVSVAGGTASGSGDSGGPGTIRWLDFPVPAGTVIMIR